MKKHCITAFLFALISLTAKGQTSTAVIEKKSAFTFKSIAAIGLLEGEDGSAPLLQSINGVHYKTWFAGIGAGLDWYLFRSFPIFLSVQKDILKKTPLYLYADAGLHFPWEDRGGNNDFYRSTFKRGTYFDVGGGYRLAVKGAALLLSAGYTAKQMDETRYVGVICIGGSCPERKEELVYVLRRISIKMGVRF